MQYTTKLPIVQLARVRLHALVVLSIFVLAALGRMPDTQAGWITCPPQVVMIAPRGERLRCTHPEPPHHSHEGDRWQWASGASLGEDGAWVLWL